jgi:flagellar protein FliO/FliZ
MITGNMELKETLRISNNKYLQIVRAGDKYLVMAVCKDTVTMLTELTEDELDFTAAPVEAGMDFKGIMEKARQRYSDSKKQDSDKDSRR